MIARRRPPMSWLMAIVGSLALAFASCSTSADISAGSDRKNNTSDEVADDRSDGDADASESATTTEAPTTTTTTEPPLVDTLPDWFETPGPIWPEVGQAALTFDDGPDPDYTRPILDILAEYRVPATFFVVGRSTVTWPELVEAMVDEGHAVGNHTWSHPNLTMLPDHEVHSQIARTNEAIEEAIGMGPRCFRAPEGAFDERVNPIISGFGLHHVLWNVDPQDYLQRPGEQMAAETLEKVVEREGRSVLIGLHDGGGPREETIAALPLIIEGIEALGYEWVRLC
jgi:peptidoglycan/xylan/chitin deacetylase (PgdA/CDA1 family)